MIKAITLRKLPPDLATAIEKEAKRTGASLNATVLRLLQTAIGEESRPRHGNEKKRDLSSFAGTWTKEEADEFDAFLADHRRIDPDDWR